MAFKVLVNNPKGVSEREFDDNDSFEILGGGVLRINSGGTGLVTNHFAPGTWIEVADRTGLVTPTLGPPQP